MKMPSKSEFLDMCKRMNSQHAEDIARYYYRNCTEFTSFEQVSEFTGQPMSVVRATKYLLTTNYGVCFCHIGNSRSRASKMIGVSEDGKGFSISEKEMIANADKPCTLKIRGKKSDPINVVMSKTNTGNLLNKVFK